MKYLFEECLVQRCARSCNEAYAKLFFFFIYDVGRVSLQTIFVPKYKKLIDPESSVHFDVSEQIIGVARTIRSDHRYGHDAEYYTIRTTRTAH